MLFALMFAMYVISLVTGFVGINSVAALCNLMMGVVLVSLCTWAYVKYSGEFREVGSFIDSVAETLWEQVCISTSQILISPRQIWSHSFISHLLFLSFWCSGFFFCV